MMDFVLDEKKEENLIKKTTKKRLDLRRILRISGFIVFCWIIAFLLFTVYSLKYRNRLETFTVGYSVDEITALQTIADSKDIFLQNYLQLESRKYRNDADAIEALRRGQIDAVLVEDISIVSNNLPQDAKIIATVSGSNSNKFVVNIKKAIISVNDLNGKIVALDGSTKTYFWLDSMIGSTRINQRVTNKNNLKELLLDGEVDAVITYQPYVYDVYNYENNKNDTLILEAQEELLSYGYLITTEKLLENQEYQALTYLNSLNQAEESMITSPEEYTSIFRSSWSVSGEYLDFIKDDYEYKLSLNDKHRALLLAQNEWIGRKNISDEEILSLFYYDLLRELKPVKVEI